MSAPLLITGAAGYLGQRVAQLAAMRWPAAMGLLHQTPATLPLATRQADLADQTALEEVLDAIQPQAIIHAAAITPSAGAHMTPEALWAANVVGTANLARWAARSGTRLVVVSSDAIWPGREAPYREADPPAPINAYGASKAAAEAVTQALCPAAALVRTSLIYGMNPPDWHTLMAWELATGRRSGALFTDEYRSPIFVDDLAHALLELVELPWAGPIHVAGPQALSRLELGQALLRWAARGQLDPPAGLAQASGMRRPSRVVMESAQATQVLKTRLRSIHDVAAQEAYCGEFPQSD